MSDTPRDRDDAINEAFEMLVSDDLEGFAIVAEIDGGTAAMSHTTADEGGTLDVDGACQIPRMEMLGRLLADFSMMLAMEPDETAQVAAHVASEHYGVDAEKVRQFQREVLGHD